MEIETIEGVKNGIETHRNLNIDNEFWKLLAIAVAIGSFGSVASYMSKIYNKVRTFSLLDLVASLIVGAFGGGLGIALAYNFNFGMVGLSMTSGMLGSVSITLLKTISEHEGDFIRKAVNFFLRTKL